MRTPQPPIAPHLVIKAAEKAAEFYQQAFGAEIMMLGKAPDGTVMHGALKLPNGGVFYLMEEREPRLGESRVVIHLEVADVDAVWKRALAAGATVRMELADQFWGARYGMLNDPFGHIWSVATQKRDVSPEELERAMKNHKP